MSGTDTSPLYEDLDHTADAAIRVHAPTVAGLFERAARAMFAIILPALAESEQAESAAQSVMQVRVDADTREALLHAWLDELLFLHTTLRVLPVAISITRCDTALEALVTITPLTDALAALAAEIKAVTWHGFRIQDTDVGYSVDIVFDL